MTAASNSFQFVQLETQIATLEMRLLKLNKTVRCANIPPMSNRLVTLFLVLVMTVLAIPVDAQAPMNPEANNVSLVGHNDLNGNGDGGEGLALQQFPDGRRLLYLAHEGQKTCLSILEVTHPENPVMIAQLPSPAPGETRCNSVGISGNILLVPNQTLKQGQKVAGLWVLDISNFASIQRAKSLEDLKLSFMDFSGPYSRGVHCVWFVDGEFAHITTGAADFQPVDNKDYQFYMTVDLRDPRNPKEVGRWWYPGTRKGDACLPECLPPRNPAWDIGYRPHEIEVRPERPDRAYMAYIEGGFFVMDISGLEEVKAGRAKTFTPKVISHYNFGPSFPGFTHTFQPIFSRNLAWVSDEDTENDCKDAPKLVWLIDIRSESNPVVVGTAPLRPSDGDLCHRGGRFGAHNLNANFPGPLYAHLKNTTVASWFNGGVRIFRLVDAPTQVANAPPQIEEIGSYTPGRLQGNPNGAPQMNHAIVDERGLIYAVDRFTGGLYILRYTGTLPMD